MRGATPPFPIHPHGVVLGYTVTSLPSHNSQWLIVIKLKGKHTSRGYDQSPS
jgi:hypothetical protein